MSLLAAAAPQATSTGARSYPRPARAILARRDSRSSDDVQSERRQCRGSWPPTLPRRQPVRGGYRLITRRRYLRFRSSHLVCEDEAEASLSRHRNGDGAGRHVLQGAAAARCWPPGVLANTDWRIVAIGGDPGRWRRLCDERIRRPDQRRGAGVRTACPVPIDQRGNMLTAGPIAADPHGLPGSAAWRARDGRDLLPRR